ncbi:hypothetical protein CUJ83_01640 [Methanocella sp. CWC-04]|uniref:Uncharacterized protein n=1 Tax=Methanooceanicella nereidis TaxID=2052831 RepID=A0AAP2W4X0_9EURY|nr:DUF3160 domain-containing protein [Methanocella sp. CWC-04]MCD1293697.1 hypothetical protein [Methanocella sp. CWC-04]
MRDDSRSGLTSRREFLKAIGAAGGIIALSASSWGCISLTGGDLQPPRPTGNITYTIVNSVNSRFAEYRPMEVISAPAVKPYSVLPDLSNVSNVDRMNPGVAEKKALTSDQFYMKASADDQIYDVYKHCKDAGIPAFVTTDALLHSYHILYDYILRVLEVDHFSPGLIELTKSMLTESLAQLNSGIEEIKVPALKNAAFFSVALSLLDPDASIPADVMQYVNKELALIEAHKGFGDSPIFQYKEDYSQYVPRGHYTRNDTLKKYFKAMMWFGRMSFVVNTDDMELNKEQTRMAILITLALKSRLFDMWKGIYEPTVFFVGETDDLSVFDYLALIKEIYGSEVSLSDLADDTKLEAFMEKAAKLKEPKIISTYIEDTESKENLKGFRFMGQRFIPDSYMFQELVYNKVGTPEDPRLFPKGLDVMAVLGSERAYEILDKVYNETRFYNYDKQLASLKEQFAAFKDDTWTQNLYWCWLYCLFALLNKKGDGYPTFMKNQAWTDKELNTSLGSWTELRHDTILYAKQSYTMKATAIMPSGTTPRGYVEPNAELYARLASLAAMTEEGLQSRGLLDDEFAGKLKSLKGLLVSLKDISEKELTGKTLVEDEYKLIENIGNTLESITTFSSAVNDKVSNDADKKMAVVADVHTDVNTDMVLEEGVGNPYHIFVIVEIDGDLVLTKGGAFSYYEFTHPMSDRLTDEKWQEMLQEGKAPATPEWTESFTL